MIALRALSEGISRVECWLAAMLAGILSLLILLNVMTRALGMAIYWVDELAIYAMVWMTFLATSVVIKRRQTLSVTLLKDVLPLMPSQLLTLFSDVMVLLFACLLIYFSVLWFDPVNLFRSGFDLNAFQMETFNFIYAESTNTLALKKYWIWLLMPWIAFSLTFHGLMNLCDSVVAIRTPNPQENH